MTHRSTNFEAHAIDNAVEALLDLSEERHVSTLDSRLMMSTDDRSAGPTSNELQVRECSDQDLWDDFVWSSPDGTVCHLFGWKAVLPLIPW